MHVALLSFASAGASALVAVSMILRGRRSAANWFFLFGLIALASSSLFDGLSLRGETFDEVLRWQEGCLMAKSFLPGIWICFSLTYSRGNYREFLKRWRFAVGLAFLIPIVLMAGFQDRLVNVLKVTETGQPVWLGFGPAGKLLNLLVLAAAVLVMINLEKTFRTAIGTMRWRIKYVILGLGVIFSGKIYTASQAMLYSGVYFSFFSIEAISLLIGCALVAFSHLRAGQAEVDVYPSQTFLYNSITIIVVGVYLLIVGSLAQWVSALGGDSAFPLKALLILVSIVFLFMVLLSDHVRQKTRRFVSRHLQRPLYDYRSVWRDFTEGTMSRVEQPDLCRAVVSFVSDLLQILSVSIWLADHEKERLTFAASTSLQASESENLVPAGDEFLEVARHFQRKPEPVDIDAHEESWAVTLRRCTPGEFRKGGHRICVPIVARGELLGVLTLGDRVGGLPLSAQDTDLLKCLADQTAASLRNIQLSQQLMQAKEMEAFQTMSAFFVHDLKNTASTFSLMLKNLPVHFNDPAFREDALRGIANTVNHINHLIGRLSLLRQEMVITPVESDLNDLVSRTLKDLDGASEINITTDLKPIPPFPFDPEQLHKVLLNLILNAREATGKNGSIHVDTTPTSSGVVLSVRDTGCGMSREFLNQSLFRPFQTTKKRGIGIGMFQSKMIVEAHRGRIEVQSTLGTGTTFRIFLPRNHK